MHTSTHERGHTHPCSSTDLHCTPVVSVQTMFGLYYLWLVAPKWFREHVKGFANDDA
jgi:hypothetical protein